MDELDLFGPGPLWPNIRRLLFCFIGVEMWEYSRVFTCERAPCKMAAIISYLLIFSQCINYPFMAFVKLIFCYVIGFSLLMSAQLERALCIDYRINITYVFHLSYE